MKKNLISSLKSHTPTFLSIVASIGVLATAALSVQATPKAIRIVKEKKKMEETKPNKIDVVKATWQCYVPAALVGLSTIGCIFGSNILSKRQQASLASAYALVSQSYKEYQEKLKSLYGEDAHKKIVSSIAVEKVDKDHTIIATSMWQASTLDFGDVDEEIHTFYDCYSGRAFESTISKVLQAEYHLNRNFALGGLCVELNEFYNLLGIDPIDSGTVLGWNCAEDIVWIDFNHSKAILDDGMEIYYIEMMLEPNVLE